MLRRMPVLYTLIVLATFGWLSWRYATNPPASSDPLSIWLGWGGLIGMVALLIYSVARKVKPLRNFARLSYWLHLHIFLAVMGVMMAVFHSMHLFLRDAPLSPLNPGFLSFAACMVVFFSGLFGRYMYSLVPRSRNGERMLASEVEKEIEGLGEVPDAVRALWKEAGDAQSFVQLIQADLATRRALSKLAGLDLSDEMRTLAKRRVLLQRRLAAYQYADKCFRRWIILHRPLAGIMYVLSAVHVALSYMFTPSLQ